MQASKKCTLTKCKRVKFTLWQATKVQMWSRGIPLPFLYLWHYMWVDGQQHTPAALPPGRLGTYCVGVWVGPRTGLDG